MYALSKASYQLRDQLIGLVGSVSQRLGEILARTQLLNDGDRARINRIASEIASLQSSILDAINSSAITTPAGLSELYDLELGAIRTIEQIESYLPNAQRAAPQYHAPQGFPPPRRDYVPHAVHGGAVHSHPIYNGPVHGAPFGAAAYHPAASHPAPPRHIESFIDVEAVPVSPHAHDDIEPAQLTPAYQPPYYMGAPMAAPTAGQALRHAVSELNSGGPPGGYAPPYYAQQPPVRETRALVVVQPAPLPQAIEDMDDDEPRARSFSAYADALMMHVASVRRSPVKIAGAAAAVLMLLIVPRFFSDAPQSGPKVSVVPVQSQTAKVQAPVSQSPLRLSPILPGATGKGQLYVPVIATVASRGEIEERLSALSRSYPNVLASPDHATIEPIFGSDGRQWYRAYLMPGRARADIQKFCQSLREAGYVQCWPKRLKTG